MTLQKGYSELANNPGKTVLWFIQIYFFLFLIFYAASFGIDASEQSFGMILASFQSVSFDILNNPDMGPDANIYSELLSLSHVRQALLLLIMTAIVLSIFFIATITLMTYSTVRFFHNTANFKRIAKICLIGGLVFVASRVIYFFLNLHMYFSFTEYPLELFEFTINTIIAYYMVRHLQHKAKTNLSLTTLFTVILIQLFIYEGYPLLFVIATILFSIGIIYAIQSLYYKKRHITNTSYLFLSPLFVWYIMILILSGVPQHTIPAIIEILFPIVNLLLTSALVLLTISAHRLEVAHE